MPVVSFTVRSGVINQCNLLVFQLLHKRRVLMDYLDAYRKLITKASLEIRSKGKGVYYEKHHAMPKSMGGGKGENLILLTAKEHYVAHHLLWKICGNKEMALAFKKMKGNNRINSKDYETMKLKAREVSVECGKRMAENLRNIAHLGGKASLAFKKGVHSLTKEQKAAAGSKGGFATNGANNSFIREHNFAFLKQNNPDKFEEIRRLVKQ